MIRLSFFFWVICILCFLYTNLEVRSQVQRDKSRIIFHNITKPSPEEEKLIRELESAYRSRDYERVVNIHQTLSPLISLSAEEMLQIAESYLRTGDPKIALDYAERAIGLRRGTELACRGRLIKSKAFLLLGREKEAFSEVKNLSEDFCKDFLEEELKALRLLYFKAKEDKLDPKILKSLTEEILGAKINQYLKMEKFREAEQSIYDYINLTGEYTKAKDYFFKLAERYFAKGEILTAKRFYQLIITEWDNTKEAFLSKFRLYQIAYERATVKELLPTKTIEDLLTYITQIKVKYPKEKIAEEASYLGIRIYFERKNWVKVREQVKEFLKIYADSQYKAQILDLFCQAIQQLVPIKFLRGEINNLMRLVEEDQIYIREASCGDFYYMLGGEFFKYKLWTWSIHYLLSAYDLKISPQHRLDYYLKLAHLAEERDERELFNLLMNYIEKKWSKELMKAPEFLYLHTKRNLRNDLTLGLKLLNISLKEPLPLVYKKELFHLGFYRALEAKKYSQVYTLIKTHQDLTDFDHYYSLLIEVLNAEPKLFEEILKDAQKRFGNHTKLSWLEAYYLERKGELKKTSEIWEHLEKSQGVEGEMARRYRTFRDLINKAQRLVY